MGNLAKFSFSAAALAMGTAFVGCGDDSSTSSDSKESSDSDLIVETFDDLVVCSSKREGTVAYVKDEKTEYTCIDKKWTADDDEDDENAKSSSSKKVTSSSSEEEESSSSSVILSSSEESSSSETSSSAEEESSSSSVILSSSEESSSSETKSSADEESSSSEVILSSSEESSSSIVSSSSVASSSSKTVLSSSSIASSSSKAISSSSKAVSSSSQVSSTLKDSRDGKTYKTVTIGTQTWMAENLNYNYNKGTAVSYCYDEKTSYCNTYGRLYTWAAAIDSAAVFSTSGKGCGLNKTCTVTEPARGICPEGWHIPSRSEWNTLLTYVGGASTAGIKLKSTSSDWYSSDSSGIDSYGFSALPAGYYYYGSSEMKEKGFFWSSTPAVSIQNAYYYRFHYYLASVTEESGGYKIYAFSVRCIKD